MPQPSNPPFADGALLQPRKLQRWLDKNRVNPLTRSGSYFVLPTFNVVSNWRNYSEVVAVFDYVATNNFSIKDALTSLPANPNYLACVAYANSDNTGARYKLWENVGEKLFSPIPLYNGERIKKKFRIEIWNVEPPNLVNFSISGAGTAAANATYVRDLTNDVFFSSNIVNTVILRQIDSYWEIATAIGVDRYHLSKLDRPAATYPFGSGWTITGGAAPAPVEIYIATTASQTTTINLYTSILGMYDYRYQDDFLVAPTPTITTNLGAAIPLNVPIVFPNSMSVN